MSEQHLHSLIGKAISEHKKMLYSRLTAGSDLETAVAQFFAELSLAFDQIIADVKSKGGPR